MDKIQFIYQFEKYLETIFQAQSWTRFSLFILWFVEDIGKSALATVLTVEVSSHENSGSALLGGTLASQTVDLAVVVHLVILQHGELDLPVLVLDLLGGGVILLLA